MLWFYAEGFARSMLFVSYAFCVPYLLGTFLTSLYPKRRKRGDTKRFAYKIKEEKITTLIFSKQIFLLSFSLFIFYFLKTKDTQYAFKISDFNKQGLFKKRKEKKITRRFASKRVNFCMRTF